MDDDDDDDDDTTCTALKLGLLDGPVPVQH